MNMNHCKLSRLAVSIAVAVFAFASVREMQAFTVSNYAIADTQLLPGIATNSNRGVQTEMYVGDVGLGTGSHILVQFSLANIPAGQVITQAVLRLGITTSYVFGPILTSDFYRVRVPWVEGDGTFAGNGLTNGTSGATWDSRDKAGSLANWTTPGAFGAGSDRETVKSFSLGPSDSVAVSGGYHLFKDVTGDVQAWYSGAASNYGWVGAANPYLANGEPDAFSTAELGNTFFRPMLVISYMVPEPTTMALVGLGALFWLRRRSA